jgi:branched-chain amino acid transport system substrate-binding protein
MRVTRTRYRLAALVLAVLAPALVLVACTGEPQPITVGAVYPLTGSQALGGRQEYRGVALAADLANADGGVDGRRIVVRAVDTPEGDAAPAAIQSLRNQGVRIVLGSNGSTISLPAADAAAHSGMLYWETGAVGDMSGAGAGRLVFRMSPTGVVLGRGAISYIADQLAPPLGKDPAKLRYAMTYVDDVYGSTVARGAREELRDRGYVLAGAIPYDLQRFDAASVVHRLAAMRPDVVFVSAYLNDGVAIRREIVRQGLPLVANIGTSSSYCMPQFGARLGPEAVGVFASDKPDPYGINPSGLAPDARALLVRARAAYRARYGEEMSGPSLSGFAAAWALFRDVLPRANDITPDGIGAAALGTTLPLGTLPNGGGLDFGRPGTPDAGANLRAVIVIWKWVGVNKLAVVWPPQFATKPMDAPDSW